GATHVVRVRRTHRLGDDVLNAERLEDSAHRATGDDTGTGLGSTQQVAACDVTALNVVAVCTAATQRDEDQIALGSLGCLADCLRHLTCLAVAEADAALLVADDDESSKAETTAALHHLGDAVDVDELIDETIVTLFAVTVAFATT